MAYAPALEARHGDMSDMAGMDESSETCEMMMFGNWKVIGSCFLTSSWHIKTAAQFAGTCIGVFLIVVLIESVRRWGREWDRYIIRQALSDHQEKLSARKKSHALQTQRQTCDTASVSSSGHSHRSGQKMDPEAQRPIDLSSQRKSVQAVARLERCFFSLPRNSPGRQALQRNGHNPSFRPTAFQQLVRSLVYAVQFAGAYLVMLIAMSYNGFILIAIVLGGLVGHFFSTWDTLSFTLAPDEMDTDDTQLMGLAEQPTGHTEKGFGDYGSNSGACCN